jgi:hypothetical protein
MGGSESSHQRCLGKEFGELLEDYGEDDESQRSDLGTTSFKPYLAVEVSEPRNVLERSQ